MSSDLSPAAPQRGGAAEPPIPQIIVQQQATLFGRFGKLLVLALVLAILAIFSLAGMYQSYFSAPGGPQEKYHSLSKTATRKIAVINVEGAILEGDGFIKQQIDRIREDENVAGIVLRINSPGGTVTGSDFIYHHLRELLTERNLKAVVSMGSICASGGYYIAMAVGDEENAIFAEPSTWTGSIGVVIPHYDLSGLMADWEIKDDSIVSHPLKTMGSPTHPMNAEERQILQGLVDASFGDFKQIVQNGRPKFAADEAALDKVATGQIFTAKQAQELGLIDEIGFIEKAVDRAVELSGFDKTELRCVKYEKPPAPLSALLGARSARHSAHPLELASLLDLTTPRAYYLWTGLPTLLSNSPR